MKLLFLSGPCTATFVNIIHALYLPFPSSAWRGNARILGMSACTLSSFAMCGQSVPHVLLDFLLPPIFICLLTLYHSRFVLLRQKRHCPVFCFPSSPTPIRFVFPSFLGAPCVPVLPFRVPPSHSPDPTSQLLTTCTPRLRARGKNRTRALRKSRPTCTLFTWLSASPIVQRHDLVQFMEQPLRLFSSDARFLSVHCHR